ncbi:LysR family transcriptional regulator [Bartonella sp. HY329]|uniref:LysR family transcriptional regulator n=1 Tax=unclassified Bartonella TaxID=2645622 RepID=UPI0021C66C89|nr:MULTISPECIES: LysR family transcriptional regulator [unclassified Bartonella]UXM95140.1 LysR family transcriptional regulator [Bartonella sp. HY329]UXN09463.1 LysR family transcriptional regulator [Bartonella sp. HY328]
MRITLRQIEYFIATAETGSISLASERVKVSSPSISTAIANLEEELQAKLFIRRHAQGLALTSAGKKALIQAKKIIDETEKLYNVTEDVTSQLRGQIAVGCMVTLAPMIMPALSKAFTEEYKAITLNQSVANHDVLLKGIQDGAIDVGLSYDSFVPDFFEFTPLADLPPHLIIAEGHNFADRSAVSLKEIADEPLLLLDLPHSREYFFSLFQQQGLSPNIAIRSPHQDVIRTMVANDYGYSIANVAPRSQIALDGKAIQYIPIADEVPVMKIGLFSLKSAQHTKAIKAFYEFCQAQISSNHIPGMVSQSV